MDSKPEYIFLLVLDYLLCYLPNLPLLNAYDGGKSQVFFSKNVSLVRTLLKNKLNTFMKLKSFKILLISILKKGNK